MAGHSKFIIVLHRFRHDNSAWVLHIISQHRFRHNSSAWVLHIIIQHRFIMFLFPWDSLWITILQNIFLKKENRSHGMRNLFKLNSYKRHISAWHMVSLISTENVLKFLTLVASQKGLDKQCRPRSEAVWSGSSLFAILTSILWIPALITSNFFEHRNKKVFKILEHLP